MGRARVEPALSRRRLWHRSGFNAHLPRERASPRSAAGCETVELVPNRVVAVKVIGDFDGCWRATLSPRNGGTHVDLVWETTLKRPWMRRWAPLLRTMFAWNHYWTTPRGEAGLKAYLAERRKAKSSTAWPVSVSAFDGPRGQSAFRAPTYRIGAVGSGKRAEQRRLHGLVRRSERARWVNSASRRRTSARPQDPQQRTS
jgi:hypothetical protein